jgi:hypothetical protein
MKRAKKTTPFKAVCDAVFKPELLPAVYRWVSALSHEEIVRFSTVFPILASDGREIPDPPAKKVGMLMQASRYTIPEWGCFGSEATPRDIVPEMESMLRRPTTSHLAYGAFNQQQMRNAVPPPTGSRASERSQIIPDHRSEQALQMWSDRRLNTTYRHDMCHSGFERTVRDQTADQTVTIYSKNTLNAAAAERASRYVDRDPVWTRNFREMCRLLSDAITATDYREAFTEVKEATGERHKHPRWRDPEPVSVGLPKPAEQYWGTTHRTDHPQLRRERENPPYDDQHRARYKRPFDVHARTEKPTTTVRDEFRDHIANRNEQPEYWRDMIVRVPPGSAPAGNIAGDGPPPCPLR